tara:strand:- start:181 stop:447 length:267 start_codon:yes stop_codon:yes gene_type:complete
MEGMAPTTAVWRLETNSSPALPITRALFVLFFIQKLENDQASKARRNGLNKSHDPPTNQMSQANSLIDSKAAVMIASQLGRLKFRNVR